MAKRIVPVILSGGAGTRLWPLSRPGRPKQMIRIEGEHTMLQQTARRTADPERRKCDKDVDQTLHERLCASLDPRIRRCLLLALRAIRRKHRA